MSDTGGHEVLRHTLQRIASHWWRRRWRWRQLLKNWNMAWSSIAATCTESPQSVSVIIITVCHKFNWHRLSKSPALQSVRNRPWRSTVCGNKKTP